MKNTLLRTILISVGIIYLTILHRVKCNTAILYKKKGFEAGLKRHLEQIIKEINQDEPSKDMKPNFTLRYLSSKNNLQIIDLVKLQKVLDAKVIEMGHPEWVVTITPNEDGTASITTI